MAIHQENLEISKVLLEFSANASTGSPLNVAVDHSNVDAVKLLLAHGADTNSKPTGGHTPLYSAAAKGDTTLMKLHLEKGSRVDRKPPGFPTALYMAVVREDAKVVRVLMSYGADINVTAAAYGSILDRAMNSGNDEITGERQLLST